MKEKKSFINRIYREKDIKKVETKINQFGVSKKFTTEYFMNFRLYSSMIMFVVLFIFIDYGALLAPIITVIWYCLVGYTMIDKPIRKREKKIESEGY